MSTKHQGPFLRLPAELRLQIYELLLIPPVPSPSPLPSCHPTPPSTPSSETTLPTLELRTVDPLYHPSNPHASPRRLRRTYTTRADAQHARAARTTYALTSNPGLWPSILQSCRQCHAEAAPLLYGRWRFSFGPHVEAVVPFLSDLTPLSRAAVRAVGVVKGALAYEREFDRAEWRAAVRGIAGLPGLRELDIAVVAGMPGPDGWDGVEGFTVGDYERWWEGVRRFGEKGTVRSANGYGFFGLPMEWVEELVGGGEAPGVRGLEVLRVKAIVEHCPHPGSMAYAAWIAFSKSVGEGSFERWLKRMMLLGEVRKENS